MSGAGVRRAVCFLFLCCAAAPALRAQSFIASRIRADNDAFDFWLAPWYRPDEEYTSGVQAALEYAGHAWWHRFFSADTGRCTSGSDRCATRTYAVGQQIYAGSRNVGDVAPVPGTRPSAGWLYGSETERIATPTHLDETSLMVGVTGPPAMAELVQRIAHGYAAAYNRPVDWSHQLPFEPGVVVRYERTQRVLAREMGGSWGVDLEPHAGAALGTVLTEGVAGLRARVTYPARQPWLHVPPSPGLEFSFFSDAEMHGVARNEFLDGTLFRSSDHVRSRPFVNELQAGFSIGWRQVGASYEVHRIGSEYVTHPGPHTWASISVEWRPGR